MPVREIPEQVRIIMLYVAKYTSAPHGKDHRHSMMYNWVNVIMWKTVNEVEIEQNGFK